MKQRLLLSLLMLLGAGLGQAAEVAWKVFFNGQPSQLTTTEVTGGTRIIPVYFPVPESGEAVYEVKLSADPSTRELRLERRPVRPKVRGDEECFYCSGSGKCQNCFPVGSGITASGATCGLCNGNTRCNWCAGSGKK